MIAQIPGPEHFYQAPGFGMFGHSFTAHLFTCVSLEIEYGLGRFIDTKLRVIIEYWIYVREVVLMLLLHFSPSVSPQNYVYHRTRTHTQRTLVSVVNSNSSYTSAVCMWCVRQHERECERSTLATHEEKTISVPNHKSESTKPRISVFVLKHFFPLPTLASRVRLDFWECGIVSSRRHDRLFIYHWCEHVSECLHLILCSFWSSGLAVPLSAYLVFYGFSNKQLKYFFFLFLNVILFHFSLLICVEFTVDDQSGSLIQCGVVAYVSS